MRACPPQGPEKDTSLALFVLALLQNRKEGIQPIAAPFCRVAAKLCDGYADIMLLTVRVKCVPIRERANLLFSAFFAAAIPPVATIPIAC